jgi:cell wall-associated NlpC family hydrolase
MLAIDVSARHPLPHLGFTLQAGAFTQVGHAARLAAALQAKGLEAAYYAAPGGFYRVRFGDFATLAEARARGEALKAAGVLEAYWIVAHSPGSARPGTTGPGSAREAVDEASLRAHLVATARGYLGIPYLFGGTTARGFDCSGLTGAVYRLNGLRLPRSSTDQYEAGHPVPLDDARPGDLLFFATAGGHRVSHVALYLGHGTFIHAPSEGRSICEDRLDERYYRDTFVGARTYLSE